MKKIILLNFIFFVAMTFCSAQNTPWILQGNNSILPGTDMLGTTDNSPIPFTTNGLERMRLAPTTGFLGLNTTAPLTRFHQHNGYLFATSDVTFNATIDIPPTSIPVSGGGIRMMWLDDLAAPHLI